MEKSQPFLGRVAIVGCGYVGLALGSALCKRGHHVTGTTTTPGRMDELGAHGITPVLLQHSETDRLRAILQDCDAVFLTYSPGRGQSTYRDVYVAGATNLLKSMRGAAVKRLIYTSSTGVYAQQDGQWVDEQSPARPQSENGLALIEAENILLRANSSTNRAANADRAVDVSVVRLSGIYGPGRDISSRVQSLAGTTRHDGNAFVNLIHLEDIVAALTALLRCDHHGVLTLSDDCPMKRRELYDMIIAHRGLAPIEWREEQAGKLGKRIRNQAIKQLLNLSLSHPRFVPA